MYTDYLNQPEYRNEILTKDSEVKNTTSHLSQDELIRAKSNITMMLAKVSDQIELLETAVEGHIDYWHDNQVLNDNGDIIGCQIEMKRENELLKSEVSIYKPNQLDDNDLLNALKDSLTVLESQYSLWADGLSIPEKTKTISEDRKVKYYR